MLNGKKRLAHMVLLMEEILHQLVGSLSVYPIIYKGFKSQVSMEKIGGGYEKNPILLVEWLVSGLSGLPLPHEVVEIVIKRNINITCRKS